MTGPGERERDADGRPRNARPRDGLGRPLPRGASGVERQPEGVVRSTRQTLTDSAALLRIGRPFHAHEVFEDAWKSDRGEHHEFWRAMAQLAVGLTHAARGNDVGASRLVARARAVLVGTGCVGPAGLDARVVGWIDDGQVGSLADLLDSAAEALPA